MLPRYRAVSAVATLGIVWAALRADNPDQRKTGPANTWTIVAKEATGARESPIFYFAPPLGKFVMSGGIDSGKSHFDTEVFDQATGRWSNAYPPGAPYKVEAGPTDAPSSGWNGFPPKPFQTDKNGATRIRMDPHGTAYGADSRAHHQWTYHREAGKLFIYFHNRTATYDLKSREWKELAVPPFSKNKFPLMYGSLAYDPVNKEIVSVGGTSDEPGGTPGTWLLDSSAKAWKKLAPGSKEFQGLRSEAESLRRRSSAFVNACRNRFYVTENEAEAKVDLIAPARELAKQTAELAAKVKASKSAAATARAAAELTQTADGWNRLASNLGTLTSAVLVEAQAVTDGLERAVHDLDAEPSGRGHSPMAVDRSAGKIVLFGGNTLDGFLADTWVYDCKTRAWEQRFPKISPSPRAGHVLAWLPKRGKVVLYGGYNHAGWTPYVQIAPMPPELWTYDLANNQWQLLAHGGDGPRGGVGAVFDGEDVLIVATRDPKKAGSRVTWSCRVVPGKAHADTGKPGVPPCTRKLGLPPADYDRVAKPDPAGVAKFLKELPVNRWSLMPKPPKGTATRDWGTCPYDTDRHQIINWGGGHSTYVGTDAAHYSMRTATWSIGYPAEDPPTRGFYVMANQTFHDRPQVPNHVWDSAAYDPVSGKCVFVCRGGAWVYDPAVREWEHPAAATPFTPNELLVALASTPKGVVCWTAGGLFLFDAKGRTWKKLPVKGGKLGDAYGDTTGICYDSKRKCLWLSNRGGPMLRYDLDGGNLTSVPVRGPVGVLMRETIYVPEIDMLLTMTRTKGEDGAVGNLAYDIEGKKWLGIELPCSDGQPRVADSNGWHMSGSRSIHYDPTLRLAIFYFKAAEVFVARLDKVGLKTFAVKLQEAKKP